MENWLEFDGTQQQVDAEVVRLTAVQGGEIEASSTDVSTDGSAVKIREGATVRVKIAPSQPNNQSAPDSEMLAAGDCQHTACIGAVEVCCGSGKVLRACIGVWGCP